MRAHRDATTQGDATPPPARTRPESTARTPQRVLPRAVAPDAARSAASTGLACIDSEVGRLPSSLGSGRHATWQPGQAAQGAACSSPPPGARRRCAGVLHLGSGFTDSDVLGSREGGGMLEAVGCSAVTGNAATGSAPTANSAVHAVSTAHACITCKNVGCAPSHAQPWVVHSLMHTPVALCLIPHPALTLSLAALCAASGPTAQAQQGAQQQHRP